MKMRKTTNSISTFFYSMNIASTATGPMNRDATGQTNRGLQMRAGNSTLGHQRMRDGEHSSSGSGI